MRRREFIALLGGAAFWPTYAGAQQQPPVVGWLSIRSPADSEFAVRAFNDGLTEVGYRVGQNVKVEHHWAEHQTDKLASLIASLVRRRVSVISIIGSTDAALAAKRATKDIPIVFANGSDPVKVGLVASLNKPGGNITGVTFATTELSAKRLEILHDLVPQADPIAVVLKSGRPDIAVEELEVRKAGETIGKTVNIFFVNDQSSLDTAFANFGRLGIRAVLVGTDPFFTSQRFRLAALAARYGLPAIYTLREYAEAGGLASYGASLTTAFRQAGIYTGRILGGEKPSDLPVMQPRTLELVVNVKTAKALGLTVPPTLLARANDVIE